MKDSNSFAIDYNNQRIFSRDAPWIHILDDGEIRKEDYDGKPPIEDAEYEIVEPKQINNEKP